MMKNKDMVVSVLRDYGAMTSSQIAVQVNRRFDVGMTPAQAAGALRQPQYPHHGLRHGADR